MKIRGGVWIFYLFICAGCAPVQSPEGAVEPTEGAEEPREGFQPQAGTFDRTPDTEVLTGPTPQPADINWSRRYQELYERFLSDYTAPATGRPVELKAASGQRVQGMLLELSPTEMKLDLGDRQVTVGPEHLHPASAVVFFPSAYAAFHARQQALEEYRAWQERYTTRPSARTADRTRDEAAAGRRSANPRPTPWRIPQQSKDPMFPIEL